MPATRTKSEIVLAVASGKCSPEDAAIELELLDRRAVEFKVSDKGEVVIHGISSRKNRPVTLYLESAERLLDSTAKFREFLSANRDRIVVSG